MSLDGNHLHPSLLFVKDFHFSTFPDAFCVSLSVPANSYTAQEMVLCKRGLQLQRVSWGPESVGVLSQQLECGRRKVPADAADMKRQACTLLKLYLKPDFPAASWAGRREKVSIRFSGYSCGGKSVAFEVTSV